LPQLRREKKEKKQGREVAALGVGERKERPEKGGGGGDTFRAGKEGRKIMAPYRPWVTRKKKKHTFAPLKGEKREKKEAGRASPKVRRILTEEKGRIEKKEKKGEPSGAPSRIVDQKGRGGTRPMSSAKYL